jgi:GTP1/Obg family GTP-binding protein
MILEQTISALTSIVLITVIVILLFTIKFHIFKKRFLKNFFELPSIIIAGPEASGKRTLIENITKDKVISHPFNDNLKLGYLTIENKKIQLIRLPYNLIDDFVTSDEFEKINKSHFLNVFDVSPFSYEIEDQIKGFKKASSYFDGVNKTIVANKIDIADNKKLNKFKLKFKKLHKTSAIRGDGLNELKKNILSDFK